MDLVSAARPLAVVLALGTLGLATVGTLFAALTAGVRARELLFPVLLLPVQVPVLLATVSATQVVLAGQPLGDAGAWLQAPRRRRSGLSRDRAPHLRVHPGRMSARATRILDGLAVLAARRRAGAGFGYAPREAVQGNVQRIMYVHVPAVLTAYLAFGLVLAGSVGALATGRAGWDRLAGAAAELGVLFTAVTIVSGSIWGKPTWGTWWTWDARLTSTAVPVPRLRGLPPAPRHGGRARAARPHRRRGRHRGRGEHPHRALLREVVARAAPAFHHSRTGALAHRRAHRRRAVRELGRLHSPLSLPPPSPCGARAVGGRVGTGARR